MPAGLEACVDHPPLPQKTLNLMAGEAGLYLLLLPVEVTMTFDYQDMIKEAEKTGQPVTRVRQLGCHDNAPVPVAEKIIDTTARVSPSSRCYQCYQPSSAPMRSTRTQFKYLIVRWLSRQHPYKAKDSIALTGEDSFSLVFNKVLGTANSSSIYGLNDDLVAVAIFEALLEREASRQYRSGNNPHLQNILNINEGCGRDTMTVFGELGTDNELKWSINHSQSKGTTWIRLLCAVFNLTRMDALTTLANILGMSFENLSKLSSDQHALELNGGSRPIEDVPASLHLPELPAGPTCAELMEKKYIYGNAGQVIGAILRYRLNGHDFCLPATVGHCVLCMGKYKPTAHFFNQHLMDKYPFAPIIFCQDMRTSLALQRMLDTTRGYTPDTVIVTAHLGSDLSVLPWSYLHGHNVVFVPAPNQACMAMIKQYKDYIIGAQAKSFRVYSGFLLHTPPDSNLNEPARSVSAIEGELLKNTVVIDEVEHPYWLTRQVIKKTVSYEEFIEWGQNLGIFKKPKAQRTNDVAVASNSLSLFKPNSTPATPQPTDITDVTTGQIFVSGGITLLHGLKDSGKSITCIAAAKAILTGAPLVKTISGGEPGKILYLDSETPQDLLTARLDQFGLVGEVDSRLFLLSKFDHKATGYAFSITDSLFRDNVEKMLSELGCRYLVLDNLTSLMADGGLYQAQTVSQLFNWIEHLARQGVGVIIVSHTLDDSNAGTAASKARGSQEFSIRAHTEIVLIRSTEILQQQLGSKTVQRAAAQDGLTVGICFKVCKAACVLQKKNIWLHLPLGASKWELLAITGADGTEIELAQNVSKSEYDLTIQADTLSEESRPEISIFPDTLSADEKTIYDMALAAGNVKTADITRKLNCSDRKARNLTKGLEEKGLLEPDDGKGSQQGYRIKHCSDRTQ